MTTFPRSTSGRCRPSKTFETCVSEFSESIACRGTTRQAIVLLMTFFFGGIVNSSLDSRPPKLRSRLRLGCSRLPSCPRRLLPPHRFCDGSRIESRLRDLEQFHLGCIGDGWSTPSGVHCGVQFLIGALAPEVHGFQLPQRLKSVSRTIAKCSAEALLRPIHQR
jgi:hypothetical protein